MASGDRRHRRPLSPFLLLLLAVTSPLISAGLGSEQEFSVCNTGCCVVEPNCSAALHVSCLCKNEPLINLRRGDLPVSVQSIRINGAAWVNIYENALLELTSLFTLQLQMLGKLTVQTNGLALQKKASLSFLDMNLVTEMEIESQAFSGVWERKTRIHLRHISRLHFQENAFSFRSSLLSPDLSMEGIKFLDMANETFNAPFQHIYLAAATTSLCRKNTFNAKIDQIEMKEVKITEVMTACINGTGGMGRLSLSDSSLGIIHRRGIYGKIENVKFQKVSVLQLKQSGVDLQVQDLSIKSSNFSEFMTRGLSVEASNSVHLSQLNVTLLHKHALIALKVSEKQTQNISQMAIHDLTILYAENGSLAIQANAEVDIRRLVVHSLKSDCPTLSWVRRIIGASESEPHSEREEQILEMLKRDKPCPIDDQPIALSFTDHNIEGGKGGGIAEFWGYLVVPLSIVVLVFIIVAALKCKQGGTRTKKHSDERPRSNATSDATSAQPSGESIALVVDSPIQRSHDATSAQPSGESIALVVSDSPIQRSGVARKRVTGRTHNT